MKMSCSNYGRPLDADCLYTVHKLCGVQNATSIDVNLFIRRNKSLGIIIATKSKKAKTIYFLKFGLITD